MAYDGGPLNGGSYLPALSADGQSVAYVSEATNFAGGGPLAKLARVYVYDRRTKLNELASLATNRLIGNDASNSPVISGDGRVVAFESTATNLVAPAGAAGRHIFVRDRQAGTTVMADVAFTGAPANADSYSPTISRDGRYVSFASYATNLIPGDDNHWCSAIYTRDLATATTTRDDVTSGGALGVCNLSGSNRPSLSDGRYVAFESDHSNLVPRGVFSGVFVHDRLTGLTSMESLSASGAPFYLATSASISADGRFVTFNTGGTSPSSEVYLRDRATGQTLGPAPNVFTTHMSADGRYVSYVENHNPFGVSLEPARIYDRVAGTLTDMGKAYDIAAVGAGLIAFSAASDLIGGGASPPTADVYLASVSQAGAPGTPTNLAWTLFGSTLTITWLPPSGGVPPTAYIIEAGSSPGAIDVANFSTGSTDTRFSASVSGSGVFYIRVRAANAAGVSDPSNEVVATIGSGMPPPGPPTALLANVAGAMVTLIWSAPLSGGAVSTYVIEAGSSPGAANLANFGTNSASTSYVASGVGPGTYFVRVRGSNSGGSGPPSNEVTVVVR